MTTEAGHHSDIYRYGSRRPAEVRRMFRNQGMQIAASQLTDIRMVSIPKPVQVEEPPVDAEEYALFRAATDLREPYRSISANCSEV